jgi:N-acetylmuramoyl-L-alanine amidase
VKLLELAVIVFCLTFAATAAHAADPAQVPYQEALAKEHALRAMASPTPAEYRVVVRAYELIVRRYPSSAFSDNALWQAAGLSRELFTQTEDPRERERAIRLLRSLVTEYPSSKLVPSAVVEIARLTGTDLPVEPPPAIVAVEVPIQPAPSAAPVRTGAPSRTGRSPVTIRAINRIVMREVVRIVVELDAEVPFYHERIDNPSRVFVDFHGTRTTAALRDVTLTYDEDVVRKVRIGRHPPDTTRVVLDVENLAGYSFFTLYEPYRLVIDCERKSAAAPPASARSNIRPVRPPTKALPSRPITASAPMLPPSADDGRILPEGIRVRLESVATVPAPPHPAPPRPPASNGAGGFSISRQLGLSASRIVIDPGHGGHDPGAMTNGVSEAELVLDVALRLEELLRQRDIDVVLTRRLDAYVPLEERTALANREGADLFLSIHANASRNTRTRGIETYFLNFATTAEAEAVAARENVMSARTMNSLPDIVKAITLDNKRDESKDFATFVQRELVKTLRTSGMKNLGVKQAPFVVLIGAEMPSILAEIAFITNRQDQQLLRKPAYRQRIAEALLNGILLYQQALKTSSKKVAKQ